MKSIQYSSDPFEWALMLCSYIFSDPLTWFSVICQNSLKKQKNQVLSFTQLYLSFKRSIPFHQKKILSYLETSVLFDLFLATNKGQHTKIITTNRYHYKHQHHHPRHNHHPHNMTTIPPLDSTFFMMFAVDIVSTRYKSTTASTSSSPPRHNHDPHNMTTIPPYMSPHRPWPPSHPGQGCHANSISSFCLLVRKSRRKYWHCSHHNFLLRILIIIYCP